MTRRQNRHRWVSDLIVNDILFVTTIKLDYVLACYTTLVTVVSDWPWYGTLLIHPTEKQNTPFQDKQTKLLPGIPTHKTSTKHHTLHIRPSIIICPTHRAPIILSLPSYHPIIPLEIKEIGPLTPRQWHLPAPGIPVSRHRGIWCRQWR